MDGAWTKIDVPPKAIRDCKTWIDPPGILRIGAQVPKEQCRIQIGFCKALQQLPRRGRWYIEKERRLLVLRRLKCWTEPPIVDAKLQAMRASQNGVAV